MALAGLVGALKLNSYVLLHLLGLLLSYDTLLNELGLVDFSHRLHL